MHATKDIDENEEIVTYANERIHFRQYYTTTRSLFPKMFSIMF
jgi:hypothetical protein